MYMYIQSGVVRLTIKTFIFFPASYFKSLKKEVLMISIRRF